MFGVRAVRLVQLGRTATVFNRGHGVRLLCSSNEPPKEPPSDEEKPDASDKPKSAKFDPDGTIQIDSIKIVDLKSSRANSSQYTTTEDFTKQEAPIQEDKTSQRQERRHVEKREKGKKDQSKMQDETSAEFWQEMEKQWVRDFNDWHKAWDELAKKPSKKKNEEGEEVSEKIQLDKDKAVDEDISTITQSIDIDATRKIAAQSKGYGTGRRKTSVARVWIFPGTGRLIVNKKPMVHYFNNDIGLLNHALLSLKTTKTTTLFDIYCLVHGGGIASQSGAVRLGIARALLSVWPEVRGVLRKDRLLTRDSRMVERKKPGQAKARKKYQWVKR